MQIDMFGGASGQPAKYVAYCDGSCLGNGKTDGGTGGWGVVLSRDTGELVEEAYGGAAGTTNNKMELTACIETLKRVPAGAQIEVFTDSQYVIKGLTEWMRGWKAKGWRTAGGDPVKNVELWKVLEPLFQARKVKMVWVRGHNGNAGNERADALAKQGANEVRIAA